MPMEHFTRTVWSCGADGCTEHGESGFERGLSSTFTKDYYCHQVMVPEEPYPRISVLCTRHWNELLAVYERLGFKAPPKPNKL